MEGGSQREEGREEMGDRGREWKGRKKGGREGVREEGRGEEGRDGGGGKLPGGDERRSLFMLSNPLSWLVPQVGPLHV